MIADDAMGPALRAWLTDPLRPTGAEGIADVEVGGFERPAAGQSSDTVLFWASWTERGEPRTRDLVLRRQAEGGIFLKPDVVREARVLQGLALAGCVPVPHVLGFESDPTILGAPFFVMSRVAGRVPAAKPSIHSDGWLPLLSAAEREQLCRGAIEVLVAIHEVDWRLSHPFLIEGGSGGTDVAGHVERLVEWYRWSAAGRPFPIIDAAVDVVTTSCATITADAPVLVWGDARPGNMIFDQRGRVAAAIDWEVASIGPPGIDLGHWLFFDAFATSGAGVPRLPGWPDRATTISWYEELSGRTTHDIEYFELLEEVFIATTLVRQADRRVEKGLAPPTTRMAHDNAVTQMIARRLGLAVPELSPDYLAHRHG